VRPRLAIFAAAATDVRDSMRRARARKRPGASVTPEQESAEGVKLRLDQTRARLRSEIPPRRD
jgi:hypothetical protein